MTEPDFQEPTAAAADVADESAAEATTTEADEDAAAGDGSGN